MIFSEQFMQRRVKKDAEEELESEKLRQIDETHWVLDLPELVQKGLVFELYFTTNTNNIYNSNIF